MLLVGLVERQNQKGDSSEMQIHGVNGGFHLLNQKVLRQQESGGSVICEKREKERKAVLEYTAWSTTDPSRFSRNKI
jgi:hypothetical protein